MVYQWSYTESVFWCCDRLSDFLTVCFCSDNQPLSTVNNEIKVLQWPPHAPNITCVMKCLATRGQQMHFSHSTKPAGRDPVLKQGAQRVCLSLLFCLQYKYLLNQHDDFCGVSVAGGYGPTCKQQNLKKEERQVKIKHSKITLVFRTNRSSQSHSNDKTAPRHRREPFLIHLRQKRTKPRKAEDVKMI